MVVIDTPVICASAQAAMMRASGRLATLGTHDLRDGFHAWFGASGRRYVASVFAFDPLAPDFGLPTFEAFVLLRVRREGSRRRVCAVEAVEWGSARARIVRDAIAAGVDEWHVHLLGGSRGDRDTIVADLRHGTGLFREVALSA